MGEPGRRGVSPPYKGCGRRTVGLPKSLILVCEGNDPLTPEGVSQIPGGILLYRKKHLLSQVLFSTKSVLLGRDKSLLRRMKSLCDEIRLRRVKDGFNFT